MAETEKKTEKKFEGVVLKEPTWDPRVKDALLASLKFAPTPKELKELLRLQTEWERGSDFIMAHTQLAARDAWLADQEHVADLLAAGKQIPRMFGRADWEHDFSEKMTAGKLFCQRICTEAAPIVTGIIQRFVEQAEALAARLDSEEQSKVYEFDKPQEKRAALVRDCIWHVRRRLEPRISAWNPSPAQALAFLLNVKSGKD